MSRLVHIFYLEKIIKARYLLSRRFLKMFLMVISLGIIITLPTMIMTPTLTLIISFLLLLMSILHLFQTLPSITISYKHAILKIYTIKALKIYIYLKYTSILMAIIFLVTVKIIMDISHYKIILFSLYLLYTKSLISRKLKITEMLLLLFLASMVLIDMRMLLLSQCLFTYLYLVSQKLPIDVNLLITQSIIDEQIMSILKNPSCSDKQIIKNLYMPKQAPVTRSDYLPCENYMIRYDLIRLTASIKLAVTLYTIFVFVEIFSSNLSIYYFGSYMALLMCQLTLNNFFKEEISAEQYKLLPRNGNISQVQRKIMISLIISIPYSITLLIKDHTLFTLILFILFVIILGRLHALNVTPTKKSLLAYLIATIFILILMMV